MASSSSQGDQRINLAALQRVDPYITTIIASASQVALYKFVDGEWEKTETEGALFVYERQGDPQYGFLVLNRLSSRNLVEPVTKELNFQLQTPFLLYKTKDDFIFGIWFYEGKECDRVTKIVQDLVAKTEEKMNMRQDAVAEVRGDLNALLQRASGQQQQRQQPPPPSGDLSALLAKANKGNEIKKQQQQPQAQQKPAADEKSGGAKLMRLLSSGSGGGGGGGSGGGGGGGSAPPGQPLPERNPPPQEPKPPAKEEKNGREESEEEKVAAFLAQFTADQRQQLPAQPLQRPPQPHPPAAVAAAAAGFRPMPPHIPLFHHQAPGGLVPIVPIFPPQPPPPHQVAAMNAHAAAMNAALNAAAGINVRAAAVANLGARMTMPQAVRNPGGLVQQRQEAAISPGANPVMARLLSNPDAHSVENLERQQRLESKRQQQQPPSSSPQPEAPGPGFTGLMPPLPPSARSADELESDLKSNLMIMDGATTTTTATTVASFQPSEGEEGPKLLSPMVFAQTPPSLREKESFRSNLFPSVDTKLNGDACEKVTPLTQEQLQQALQHLLRTDTEFVSKLHRAYIDSINKKVH